MPRKDDSPRPPSVADDRTQEEAEVTSPSVPLSPLSSDDEHLVTELSQVSLAAPVAPGESIPTNLPPPPPEPTPIHNRSPAYNDPRIGQTLLGRYRLDRLVGKGGMGRVYKAMQFPLNRAVAVKILNPEFQRKDPQFVRRFFLEAASAARLSHPNTITVFDYGESEKGELFIAMEYLSGQPLSRVISSEGPLEPDRVLHVSMQICRALREAHAKGIIHRDLKPGNILLSSEDDDLDFVKVLDFGLVKLFNPNDATPPLAEDPITPDPDVDLTKAGMFLGSPKYMSPEQIQGVDLDPRTDIYSLGVLMYQMAAQTPPFLGKTSVEVIYKHVKDPVPLLSTHGVNYPQEVEAIIRKCLAKHRDDRFASMNELLGHMKDVQRILFNISSAGATGIDIRLSDLHPPTTDLPAVGSTTGSIRPQTHPGFPVARPLAEHEAFAETGPLEETGSGVLMPQPPSPTARYLPVVAAGLALLITAFVGAFVVLRDRPVQPKVPSAETEVLELPAAATKTAVRLVTTPAGADVFEDGVHIGRTPLSTKLAPTETDRELMFKLQGYKNEIRNVRVATDPIELQVELAPDEESEDYKENPY